MATFLQDTVTGTNGTNLTAHNADVGGAGWTSHPASGDSIVIDTNRARSNGSEGDYYHSVAPGASDYDVSADVFVSTNSNYAGVNNRMDVSATTWYGAGYTSAGNWELFRGAAGSFTTLGTYVQTLSVGSTYNVRLSVSGTGATVSITVYVDGVSRITYSDTNASRITATNKAGVYTQSGAGNGYHLDNITGATAAAATTLPVRNRRPTRVWLRRVYA